MGVRHNHTKYGQEHKSGGQERKSQGPDLHFKICYLEPNSAFFGPKPPKNLLKTAKCKEIVATLHMQLDSPVPKGPLGISNSTICLQTAPKRPPKAPQFVHIPRPFGLHKKVG